SFNILRLSAWPQSIELFLIEQELNKTAFPENVPIVLVGTPGRTLLEESNCDAVSSMGCLASAQLWVLPNIVRLWMRAKGIDDRQYQLLFVPSRDAATAVSFGYD